MKENLLLKIHLRFLVLILLLTNIQEISVAQSSRCIDLGVGSSGGNDEYMFIDFFRSGQTWNPRRYVNGGLAHDTIRDWYRVYSLDDFKVVNGSYWQWDFDRDGKVDNKQYGDRWADCFINYWDMMIDQGKVTTTGYPISVPLSIYPYKNKKVDPAQGIDNTKPIIIGEVERRIYMPPGAPTGPWIMKWKGKGKFTFEQITNVLSNQNCTVTLRQNSFGGGGTYEFVSGATGGGKAEINYQYFIHGSILKIESSDASDPIRDIVFLYPGMEALYDGGQEINPKYLEKFGIFKALRFMGYNYANGIDSRKWVPENHPFFLSHYIKEINWNDRAKANWYTYYGRDGGAHEYIVEIANKTKADAWVNIPYCAGRDYVINMIKFYMANLSPDITLYVEFGNELWNSAPGFQGFHWLNQTRGYYYPGLGDVEARGTRTNDILKWVGEGAGSGNMERIVRVVGAFPEYHDVTNRTINFIQKENWDALATTWYFDLTQDNSGSNKCKSPNGLNWRSELYNYWQTNPTNQTGFNAKYKECVLNQYWCGGSKAQGQDVLIAKSYGKKLVCYEGGNHTFYGCENGPTNENKKLPGELDFDSPTYPAYITDNGFINAVAEADKSPELADIYNTIIDSLKSAGFSLANHLSLVGGSSCYGVWSFFPTEDMDEELTTIYSRYPKFKAFNERIKAENCTDLYINLPQLTSGAGLSIKLDGFDDYIQADNNRPDESGSFSIESWIKPNQLDTTRYIYSLTNNSQPANSSVAYVRKDGKVVWEMKAGGTVMKITSSIAVKPDKWYHVALTRNGQRFTMYLNGKDVSSTNSAITPGVKDKFSIGALVTSTGVTFPFQGEIDEVRVWNTTRTEADIREFMCKKIPNASIPPNLITYLRIDDGNNSTTIANLADATKNAALKNIAFGIRSGYAVSGAPIGDISKYRYESTWSGISMTLSHTDGDLVGVNNMGPGSPDGVHIYYVNEKPHFNEKPLNYNQIAEKRYFGVFLANGSEPSYDVTYMYQGNPEAGSAEDMLRLLKRDNAAVERWQHSGAKLDGVANILTLTCKEVNRGEYNLGFRQDNKVLRPGSGMALRYNTPDADGKAGAVTKYLPNFSDYTITWWGKGSGQVYSLGRSVGTGGSEEVGINDDVKFAYRFNAQEVQFGAGPDHGDKNTWYHYAVTRKGTKVTLYVNGNIVHQKDYIGTYTYNQIHLLAPPDWQQATDIAIDEFTLWNAAIDQPTIRDWMCKKITGKHPYSCKNLLLYFNFDEGQGNILEDKNGPSDMMINPGYYTYQASGAAIGDESAHDYVTPGDITFAHPNGDAVEAKQTTSGATGVHLYRVDNMPPVTVSVNDPAILSLDSSRYWGIYVCNPNGVTSKYEIKYNYKGNTHIQEETNLRLLSRLDNAAPNWTNPTQTVDNAADFIKILDQARGEYVLGGKTSTTFTFGPPAVPVFVAEKDTINTKTICGNTKGLVYKVQKDPSAISYVWTLPKELDGFSNKDSILINASYLGSTPATVTISVVAVNAYGKSAAATYQVIVNPQPSKADAGPNQMILPPATSATMDGNALATGETGTWTLAKGNGTIVGVSDPKTAVNSLQNGVNVLVWTIKQNTGTCPATSDSVKITLAPPPIGITLSNGGPLPSYVCGGTTLTLQATPPEDITPTGYQWTLPTGMTLVSQNENTAIVQVASNASGGSIKVSALYNTSPSIPFESSFIAVRSQPEKPVVTNAPSALCFKVPFTLEATLNSTIDSLDWQFPFGVFPTQFPKSFGHEIEIHAIQKVEGYIKVKAYNDGCTNNLAVDSFFVQVKDAPAKPNVLLNTDGGVADPFCNDHALYSVENPDPTATYHWEWDSDVNIIEYFGANNHSALFDMPQGNTNVWVYAKTNGTECNVTEKFNINGWHWNEGGFAADPINITDPTGQQATNLQVGQTYTLNTSCATCPSGADDRDRWQNKYYWDLPLGVTLIDDGNVYDNTIKINVDRSFAGEVRVWAITLRGCVKSASTINISTPDGIFPPEYVSGEISICANNNLNITVKNVGAEEYIWQLPDGSVPIKTTSPILDILVDKGMSGVMTVKARKGTVLSNAAEISIVVKASTLGEPSFYNLYNEKLNTLQVCENDKDTKLFIGDIYANEYIWDVKELNLFEFNPRFVNNVEKPRSTGRDTMIVYSYSSWRNENNPIDDGYLFLTSKNGCGGDDRKDSIYYTYAQSPTVQIPSFLDAPTTVCAGSKVTYRVKAIPNIEKYIWNLPSGLSALELVTSVPQITVNVSNGTGGKITVYGESKVCGGGKTSIQSTENITIQGSPIDFKFTDAPLAACAGDTLTFKVNNIEAPRYTWSLPGGLGNVITDDADPSTQISGTWSSLNYPAMTNGKLRETENNNLQKKITYNPVIPENARYKVFLSYSKVWNSTSQVRIAVQHKAGSDTVTVDQNKDPDDGIWQLIGEWAFDKGQSSKVEILTHTNGRVTRADALKLVSQGIDGDTAMSFVVKGNESGSVCVTVPVHGCPAGYQICTDNINLGGKINNPSFTSQKNNVCEGETYQYTASDVGADTYTWVLPAGWKIGTLTDTVRGQQRTVQITAGPDPGSAVKIGVRGEMKSCGGLKSEIAFTNTISYTGACKLAKPVFAQQHPSICENGTATFAVNPVPNAESYEWELPNGVEQDITGAKGVVITTTPTIEIKGAVAGSNGFIKVKAKSASIPESEIASTDLEVTVVPGASAGLDSSFSICGGQSTIIALFERLGGSPASGGTWRDLDNSNAFENGTFTSASAEPGKAYRFEYVIENTGCKNDTALVAINLSSPLIDSVKIIDATSCTGKGAIEIFLKKTQGPYIIDYTGDGQGDYTLIKDTTYTKISLDAGQTINSVQITDNSICASATFTTGLPKTINAPGMPDISATDLSPLCANGTDQRQLHATPFGGLWQVVSGNGSVTDDSLFIPGAQGGSTKLSYTTNGCSASIDISVVSLPENRSITFDNSICEGEPAKITLINSESGVIYFLINQATSLAEDSASGNGSNLDFLRDNITSNTTYQIRAKRANAEACSIDLSEIASITVVKGPQLSAQDPAPTCKTVDLTQVSIADANNTNGEKTYWSDEQLNVEVNNPASVGKGTYYVKVSTAACFDTVAVTVTETSQKPDLDDLTLPALCKNATVDLATVTVNDRNSLAKTFTYYTDPALNNILNSTEVSSGVFYCKGEAEDGCWDNATITVPSVPDPSTNISVITSATCLGDTAVIKIDNSEVNTMYYMKYSGLIIDSIPGNGSTASMNWVSYPNKAGSYMIALEGKIESCEPVNLNSNIEIVVNDKFKLGPIQSSTGDFFYCDGEVIVYKVDSIAGANYVWSFGMFSSGRIKQNHNILTIDYTDFTGDNPLAVKVENQCGINSDSIIEIKKGPECPEWFVPNVLTPEQNDGVSVWQIEGKKKYPKLNVRVYNRWGGIVFEDVAGYLKPWDGTYNGQKLPTGTYYYVIDKGNGKKEESGSVTIIR